MIGSINTNHSLAPTTTQSIELTSLQQTTHEIFSQIKESVPQNISDLQQTINFRPLLEPGNAVTGGFWTALWGFSASFLGSSLSELYKTLTSEHPAAEKFARVGSAVKAAFVDLISLGGATAYIAHWAHEVKILSLGQYATLINRLCYGASLITNTVECGWSIYNIHTEKEAILKEASPIEKEKHKQRLCLSLIKVIANINMIAWAILKIATIAVGLATSPILLTVLLVIGGTFSVAACFYQTHIKNDHGPRALPKPNSLTASTAL
jgi:hypothetical protein